MNMNAINPYVRVAMHSVLSERVVIRPRVIYDYEIIYIERGSFLFEYNGITHTVGADTAILICPWVRHAFCRVLQTLSQPHIHFDMVWAPDSPSVPVSFKDAAAFTKEERVHVRENIFGERAFSPFLNISDREAFLRLFYGVIDAPATDTLSRKAKMTALLALVIADNFADCFASPPVYGPERHIKDFIDAGQGVSFSLDDFARQFSYNKFYLEKRFRDKYGVGIMTYKRDRVMQSAKEMLRSHSVTQVAAALGFGSVYAFSRAYKNHFGVSPTGR